MIEVVVARLDEPTEAIAALSGSLSEEEAGRAARLRLERDLADRSGSICARSSRSRGKKAQWHAVLAQNAKPEPCIS
jgi:hypothetical protein